VNNEKYINHLSGRLATLKIFGADWRIILKWILKIYIYELELSGSVTGSSEHGNEPLGSIKSGEFLDKLSHCSQSTDLGSCSYSSVTD
jgi:hypothetical protein